MLLGPSCQDTGLTTECQEDQLLCSFQNGCEFWNVKEILENDCDAIIDFYINNMYEPALISAVRHYCGSSVLKLLMSHGGDPNCSDSMGWTTLTAACGHSYIGVHCTLEIVVALISAGVNPRGPDDANRIPADLARKSGNLRVARYLDAVIDVWACTAICHGQMMWVERQNHNNNLQGSHFFGQLTTDLFDTIFSFVLPADVVNGLHHLCTDQENVVSIAWSSIYR